MHHPLASVIPRKHYHEAVSILRQAVYALNAYSQSAFIPFMTQIVLPGYKSLRRLHAARNLHHLQHKYCSKEIFLYFSGN